MEPLRTFSQRANSKLYIYLGDITELQIDAIVNAANSSLLGGGGVDGAIHAAAGPALREECSKLGGCTSGDAKITKGHGLPAKHIIHTVGPRGKNPETLRSSYSRCFELLLEHDLKSIAFPCISTGVYGYPNKAAAEVAIETTRNFLENNLENVEAVIFCLFTNKDIEAYHNLLPAYFPLESEKYVKEDEKSEVIEGDVLEDKRESKSTSGDDQDYEESKNFETDRESPMLAQGKGESGTKEETDNGARCQDMPKEEQADSLTEEQSEPMSQEQTSQISTAENDEKEEEPMSQDLVEPNNKDGEPMSQVDETTE